MRRSYYVLIAAGFAAFVAVTFLATQTKAQTACPISGKAIEKQYYADFQGQRVYFCCPQCPAEFRADPEKFFVKVASDGTRLENLQTTCPVSGERLPLGVGSQAHEVQYKGRTVRFCCDDCPNKFTRDPDRYLAQLPGDTASPDRKAM